MNTLLKHIAATYVKRMRVKLAQLYLVLFINPFQPSVAFHIETNHLFAH